MASGCKRHPKRPRLSWCKPAAGHSNALPTLNWKSEQTVLQLPARHKFLARKQPLLPAGPSPGASYQQCPRGAQQGVTPNTAQQAAADVAPVIREPNSLPGQDVQEKGADTVSSARLEGSGEERDCSFSVGKDGASPISTGIYCYSQNQIQAMGRFLDCSPCVSL